MTFTAVYCRAALQPGRAADTLARTQERPVSEIPSMSEHIFTVHPQERLAVVQWFGQATFNDVVEWIDEVMAHPEFSIDFDGIVDLRKADLSLMTPTDVTAIAQIMIDRKLTRGAWVHLVSKAKETALSMVYSRSVGAGYRMQVFSTLESAAEYLGRDTAVLERVAGR
jgi:hypothetical protein